MGMEELVRKKLEILLKDPVLIESYLKVNGSKIDMKKIEDIIASQTKKIPTAQATEKDDPTFQILLKCPVCGLSNIPGYELKSKTVITKPDRFMVPRYESLKGFRPLNYSTIAVTVCSKCLFASPDKKDFITFSMETKSEVKSQLGPFIIEELKNKGEERKLLIPEGMDCTKALNHPRSVDAAIFSYRLALQRATVEQQFDGPLSSYKAGMYCLKIALFQRDSEKDDEQIVRLAIKHLKNSYVRNEAPSPDLTCQLIYTLVALLIRIQEINEAQTYFGLFEKLRTETANGGPDGKGVPASLDRWMDLARDLISDRENPELWKH